MKRVTPSSWLNFLSAPYKDAGIQQVWCAPWKLSTSGRGQSGRNCVTGRSANCFFQYAWCDSPTSPCSHLRCQTAKSAYWMDNSGNGDGWPCSNASQIAVSSFQNTLIDHPSDIMWCMLSKNTYS